MSKTSPFISVIVPTWRVGGLDVLFSSLQNQLFQDFELILVDSLYHKRKELVANKINDYSFKIKHLPPISENFTATGYCHAVNTGLVNASGKIILFLCDYTWLSPDCLQIHADFHQKEKLEDNCALLCPCNSIQLPKLHPNLDKLYAHNIPFDTAENKSKYLTQDRINFNNYIADINSGKLDPLMWSIFEEPISEKFVIQDLKTELIDPRSLWREGFIAFDPKTLNQAILKNESYVLETILKINGLNENLDTNHGWQDAEFIDRLITLTNTKLFLKPEAITAYIINPRTIFAGRARTGDVYANQKIWQDERSNAFKETSNKWDLLKPNNISSNINKKMKIAFIFGAWSVGARPLDFNNLWSNPRGLTGSDLGVAITAKEMAKLGHDVSLFTVHADSKPAIWEGVKLFTFEEVPTINSDFDAVISWSEPDNLRLASDKSVRVVCQMLNDFTYCHPGFDEHVDVWTAPCQKLIDHLSSQPGAPNKEKFVVLPLGCDPSWYSDQRIPGRVIWCSSADRGLHWLLQEWPKIKAAVPFADLRIYYNFNYNSTEGIEPNSNNHSHFMEMGHRARYMKEAIKRLKHLGVLQVGSVSRDMMHQEMSMASVLAFPCDPIAFTEGFSVATLEAHASYTVPVITNADCLGSIYDNSGAIVIETPLQQHLPQFTDAVIRALTDKQFADATIAKCMKFAEEHTWAKSAKRLETIIKNHMTI